ncbi:hypothetical protein PENANT_c005G05767 [Penicillium antarcticum]|uniref:Uncharacterized protein n=1 Tax=Penicillium antarcticum TaxID=416450 RepID=A0A1V6QEN1_9EURO|nr:hypothetical protein PENANT_c005G05767 [Penicillium antarcticum]
MRAIPLAGVQAMANSDLFPSASKNEGAFAGPCHPHHKDEPVVWVWFDEAGASVVDVYAYELPDRTVYLIDTPGFDKSLDRDGESHGGALAWIARYNDGTWDTSEGLLERYEHLGEQITSRGFQKLEMCVLGPGNAYYARWQDGSWACHGESEYRNAIRTYSSIDDGSTILNLALGYGGSYVISYGRRDDMRRIKSVWNLCGHYEHLAKFLENNHDISIAALALDPTTNTSYVIIFEETNSVGRWHTRWYGIRRLEKPVRDWWHKAG